MSWDGTSGPSVGLAARRAMGEGRKGGQCRCRRAVPPASGSETETRQGSPPMYGTAQQYKAPSHSSLGRARPHLMSGSLAVSPPHPLLSARTPAALDLIFGDMRRAHVE